jgi:Tol biopolymer transport system component
MIGKTISHYKILEHLGGGGMGVVYKAQDTKLDRFVALKFLPTGYGTDKDEKQRFIHEAKAASALDHPNICTIHEINETVDGQMFIAMACYDGETLKKKIERGNMKVDAAIDIAIQVAEGLTQAHQEDIIHRDIKPANVMVTDKGVVKIVDFGLAKLAGQTKLTKATTTLGTAAYMSPEQTRGDEVDRRADIWSFGVVLYEMLTGELPFKGDYDQAVMYSILNEEPEPVTAVRTGIPMELEHIVNKALEKENDVRYQHADEMLADLKRVKRDTSKVSRKHVVQIPEHEAVLPPVKTQKRMPKSILISATLVLAVAFLVIGYNFFLKKSGEPKIVQTRPLTQTSAINEVNPALSPDGTRLAYAANEGGNWDIWVLQIATGQKINLTKDYEGDDLSPAWSPAGDWIAFFSQRNDGGIFIMSALGGPTRQVTVHGGRDSPNSWSPDGTKLVYSTQAELFIVPTRGGTPKHIPSPHAAWRSSWSPDGNRIAYQSYSDSLAGIWTISPDGSDPVVVIEGSGGYWNPIWTNDGKGIFFKSTRGGIRDIWWVPVGPKGKPTGPAKPVTVGVGVSNLTLSRDGAKVAYTKQTDLSIFWSVPLRSDHVLTMDDALQINREAGGLAHLAISPDHKWLAFNSNRSGNQDIWLMRKDGRDLHQLTTDKADDSWPTWSPDGSQIAFQSDRSGNADIYLMSVRSGFATALTRDAASDIDPAWSPVGDDILFVSNRSGNWDIWAVSVGTGDLRQLTTDKADDSWPTLSPDGRYISFFSRRTGAGELFVLPVNGGEPVQLTDFGKTSSFGEYYGARDARSVWSLNGRTIYITYELEPEDPGRDIWAVSVEDGSMRKVLDFKSGGLHGFMAGVLANDGERLYFSEKNFASDLWLAELDYE